MCSAISREAIKSILNSEAPREAKGKIITYAIADSHKILNVNDLGGRDGGFGSLSGLCLGRSCHCDGECWVVSELWDWRSGVQAV